MLQSESSGNGGRPHSSRLFKILKSFAKMVRPRTFLLFSLISPLGSILASPRMVFQGIIPAIFAGFVTVFGLVLNDVEDSELDGLAGKHRNPISTGELSKRKGLLITSTFLLLSLLMIPFLNTFNQILGLVVIFLFYSYSSGIRTKSKPIFDVAYHGLCLTIFAVMGYVSLKPFDFKCLLFSIVIFFLSSISEILQEIRDWETDRKAIKTTVTGLGKKGSLVLCLIFFSIVLALFAVAPLFGILPFEYLLLSPITYFVVSPIVKAINNLEYADETIIIINRRVPILTVIMVSAYLLFNGQMIIVP